MTATLNPANLTAMSMRRSCSPQPGMSSTPSAGTGTVFRRPILTGYATRAGFSRVEVLPIEDFSLFRFYRLHH
jgi:hypothetical protein